MRFNHNIQYSGHETDRKKLFFFFLKFFISFNYSKDKKTIKSI